MAGGSLGFIQLRRGLDEHWRNGKITPQELTVFVAILFNANPSTGICRGSAGLFSAIYGMTARTCRDSLEQLEKKGYLRRFPVRGKHGSYPILVHKFLCSAGAMKGLYVNATKSVDCDHIFYEQCDDDVDDSGNDSVNDSATSKRLEKREERKEQQELTLLSPSATTPPVKKIRLQDFPEAWNLYCGSLPKVEAFSESRKKKVTARIRQGVTVERFAEAVKCCIEKPFLRGEGASGWVANFDWLVKNDTNIEKAITQPYGLNRNGANGNGSKKIVDSIKQANDEFDALVGNQGTHGEDLFGSQPAIDGGAASLVPVGPPEALDAGADHRGSR